MRAGIRALITVGLIAVTAAAVSPSTAAAAKAPRQFFGIDPQAPLSSADLARMRQAGLGTLRIGFSWPAVDPAAPAGGFNWGPTDGIVLDAARNGMRLLPVIYGSPSWVAALDGRTCYPLCATYAPRSKAALKAWASFVSGLEDRYGPRGAFWALHPEVPSVPIRAWQIWNEQNSGQYFTPRPNVPAYARMLHSAAGAIRSRDRGAEIVLGGMFGQPNNGEVPGYTAAGFLRRLYRVHGIKRRFDTVAIHPYAASLGGMNRQVQRIRDQLKLSGDRHAQIRITELGWASGGPPHPLNKGPRGQARFLRGSFRYFLRHRRGWNVRGVNWFSWRDASGAGLCKWCPESGLFEEASGFLAKPALAALTRITGGS